VPKCLEYVIEWGASAAVCCRPGEDKSQIAKVGRGLFDLAETLHAYHCGHRPMPACDNDLGSVLGVGNQPRNSSLGGFAHADLAGVVKDRHARTVQKYVQDGEGASGASGVRLRDNLGEDVRLGGN
jgi:hypothetical protein